MLAGFCLCFCVDARGQFTVEVIQPEIIKANEKPYFVMFSATYCEPCQRWKATELQKLNKAGYQVTVINIDQDDQWNKKYGVTTVPRFFLLDRKTRRTLKGPWIGFTPALTMIMGANGKGLLAPADHSGKVTSSQQLDRQDE
jgi:thiol-disulfide isomerase/thioredoxin